HVTIPTYRLYGIEAIPADVVVGANDVRDVEPGSGRALLDVKRTPDSYMQAGVPGCPPILGRRELAPETISTGQSPLPREFDNPDIIPSSLVSRIVDSVRSSAMGAGLLGFVRSWLDLAAGS